jgi:multidrug efflux pump subunit AcrA (membrane-fusion protein)
VGQSLSGNPNPGQSAENEAEHYESQTKAAEAKHKYISTVNELNNPPSVIEMQKEQAQRLADEAKSAQDRANAAEERERERAQKEADEAKRLADEAQQNLKAAEQALRDQQTAMLLEKLEELKGSQKPILEQFQEYFAFAEQMGFQKPGTTQPQSENPQIALEIAKINAESAQRQREWELQMEDSRRKWDLEMIKMKDNQELERAKLSHQVERDRALMNAPQLIGAALAQGLVDQSRGGGAAPAEQVIQSRKEEPVKITAGPGDRGEIECPYCHTMMAIGPTSVITKCMGCNREYPIERVAPEEPIPPEEE